MMTEEKLKEIEGKIKSLTAAEVQDIQKRIRTELYNYGIKKWPHFLGAYIANLENIQIENDNLDSELGFIVKDFITKEPYLINLRVYFEHDDFEDVIIAIIKKNGEWLEMMSKEYAEMAEEYRLRSEGAKYTIKVLNHNRGVGDETTK